MGIGLRAHSKQGISFRLPASDFHAAQREDIFARTQAEIVGDVNGRYKKAKLTGQMFAQSTYPSEHLTALLFIHKRNELKTNLQTQLIHFEQRCDVLCLRLLRALALRFDNRFLNGLARNTPSDISKPYGRQQK